MNLKTAILGYPEIEARSSKRKHMRPTDLWVAKSKGYLMISFILNIKEFFTILGARE